MIAHNRNYITQEATSGEPSDPPLPAGASSSAPAHADRRLCILAAAMTCFARTGFHGTSIRQVCTEAEMSPGALYRYFPSKEAIIAAIVEDNAVQRRLLIERIAQSSSVLDGISAYMRQILEAPPSRAIQLGAEISAEAIRNPKLGEALKPIYDETRERLRAILQLGVAQGEIDPTVDLNIVIILLQAIGDGTLLHHHLHAKRNLAGRSPDFEHLMHRMLAPRAPKGS